MITITRSLARELRVVFRHALDITPRGAGPPIHFCAGPAGMSIQAVSSRAAAEYHSAGDFAPDEISVPFDLLTDCAGKSADEVVLQRVGDQVSVNWTDTGVPQLIQYLATDAGEPCAFPGVSADPIANPPTLITALRAAMDTTDRQPARYATGMVQLQGDSGEINATDGRQLLVQAGFHFPWDGSLLIPRTRVFGCQELSGDEPVRVSRSEGWVTFQIGPWTIALQADAEAHFPQVHDLTPNVSSAQASVRLCDSDAEFLIGSLGHLPASDDTSLPVTIDLNGEVAVRATSPAQPTPTEVVLVGSHASGEPVRINTNRMYLARSLRLGFRELHVFGATSPVLCRDRDRTYVWTLLDPESAIAPHAQAVRIESSGTPRPSKPRTRRQRRSLV